MSALQSKKLIFVEDKGLTSKVIMSLHASLGIKPCISSLHNHGSSGIEKCVKAINDLEW